MASNGHILESQDEVDDFFEPDDAVDGGDMPNGATLKNRLNFCKTRELHWQNLCEHFASNYMNLAKQAVTDSKIRQDEIYYEGKINELVRYFHLFYFKRNCVLYSFIDYIIIGFSCRMKRASRLQNGFWVGFSSKV